MRVTTKMLTASLLNNVNNNLSKLQEYENQLSSHVKVDKASDDPVAAAKILKAKSALNSQEQYSTNMEYASGLLTTVDGALASVNDVLLRARTITVSGSTGTTTKDSMQALADEVDGLIGEMVQVANTDYNGSYVFAGGETSAAPFTTTPKDGSNISAVQFISSADSLDETYSQKVEIASGVTIDISAGRTTFHTVTDGKDDINSVFQTMIKLRDSLKAGDQAAVSALLSDIDAQTDNVISERAVVGAKSNRIELAQNRAETYNISLTTLISTLGDADYAEASALYSSQQAVYEASLLVGAKIIQPSLLDFLK
jgi:flagellar hook-associated protein 3 FlgL